jgi:O-antigen ligase
MIQMLERMDLDKTYQFLLIILAFLMPITVAGANIIIGIICLLWLFSGNYKAKYTQIIESKLMVASIIFFGLHVLGLIWTENIIWGLTITHKMWYFLLLFPVLHSIVNKDYIRYYIFAFLIAITITEIISYLVWFQVIEYFKNAYLSDPSPFMSHISYNVILAFSIYLVGHELIFNKTLSKLIFFWYGSLAIAMIINMFITQGRAGQAMFFVVLAFLIFQFFDKKRFKAMILIAIFIPSIFLTAYISSPIFNKRVDRTIINFTDMEQYSKSSVGLRILFAKNSWEIIKSNFILGVGTGDFPDEYKKVNQINSPGYPIATNPHNMYTLVFSQLGLLGLLSMLSIMYYQIKLSLLETNKFYRDVGFVLPILFLVIMWSDSYLLGHYTALMYVFFSSFLYKRFD